MIPLLVRLLSTIFVLYILYLVARSSFLKRFSKGFGPAKREVTDYDKNEWEKIKKSLLDEFPEDHKKP